MDAEDQNARELRAAEALIAAALNRVNQSDDAAHESLPKLTTAEKAAWAARGPGYVARLLAKAAVAEPTEVPRNQAAKFRDASAVADTRFALNRAEDIDDEAAAEIEKSRREIADRLAREQGQESPDDKR